MLINVVCESQNYVNNLILHSLHSASSHLISHCRLMTKDPLKTTKFYRKTRKLSQKKLAHHREREARKICSIENVKQRRSLRRHNFAFFQKSPITLKVVSKSNKQTQKLYNFQRQRKISPDITCGDYFSKSQPGKRYLLEYP